MEKGEIVVALGQTGLLVPARIRSALSANNRIKFMLTVLQAAQSHAVDPTGAATDLAPDFPAADMSNARYLIDLPASAWREGDRLRSPFLDKLLKALGEDICQMERPFEGRADHESRALLARVDIWRRWLEEREGEGLQDSAVAALTTGKRGGEDTFHILVMDLHKAINRLAAQISDETIDGAHVWSVEADDRPRISAFMRGLNRTRALKFDHVGLDTAATRDGARLLIQNDIGTNDAHVLVIEITGKAVSLTYSDLHDQRFAFFRDILAEVGAVWSDVSRQQTAGLNDDANYIVGKARFETADDEALDRALEALGARIVFLIDWNRARKRLNRLVGKAVARDVLGSAARLETGHMGWLLAGGETLVFGAMEALGPDHFRIGDRLDQVMGEAEAKAFLIDVLAHAKDAMTRRAPHSEIADQTRLLLLRRMSRHVSEFNLLEEHGSLCHALAEAIRDALLHRTERDEKAAGKLAARAKSWERKADHLVIHLREETARNARRKSFLDLIEEADDIADAFEEAIFNLSLIAAGHGKAWNGAVRAAMSGLADKALDATQDHVRALRIAATLNHRGTADDEADFLSACWRIVHAERICDGLAREARRVIVRDIETAAGLHLAERLIAALEEATDALLRTGYAMRSLVLQRIGASESEARA